MPLDSTSVVVRAEEPMSAMVENILVLFSAERNQYIVLDEISTAIWRGIDQPIAVAELCEALGRDFDVDRARCEADVLRLLEQLEPKGLVRVIA